MEQKGPRETAVAIFIARSVSRTEQISRLTAQVVILLLRSIFVLRGKGKADDKVPRTESEETDGAQGWLCSFICIFSFALPCEIWFFCLSRSGCVPQVEYWGADCSLESRTVGPWVLITGALQFTEDGYPRFLGVTVCEESARSFFGSMEP